MKNRCLFCNEEFVGRLDKKFCTDQCRNSFNIQVKRDHEKYILEINRALRKNRTVLKQFNPEGKTTVRKEYLTKMGFSFKYFTHEFTTINNNTYKFCYEYGYFPLPDGKVLIINEQSYMGGL